jgi:GntR family transcriptional regulator
MSELVTERVVVRQQGRGTFLTPLSSERMANVFWHVARKDGSREAPIVQNLSFARTTADAATAHRLALEPGAPIYHIANLMMMGGNPVVVDDLRIPQSLFAGLTKSEFVSRETSIYGFYQSRFRINVVKAIDHVDAIVADVHAARLLGVTAGTPLLRIWRLAYTFGDVPIECRRWLLQTKDYDYMNVTGGDSAP